MDRVDALMHITNMDSCSETGHTRMISSTHCRRENNHNYIQASARVMPIAVYFRQDSIGDKCNACWSSLTESVILNFLDQAGRYCCPCKISAESYFMRCCFMDI